MDKKHAPSRPIPAGWLETIERGEADLAAGRTVPASIVLAELRADNERLVVRLAKKAADAA